MLACPLLGLGGVEVSLLGDLQEEVAMPQAWLRQFGVLAAIVLCVASPAYGWQRSAGAKMQRSPVVAPKAPDEEAASKATRAALSPTRATPRIATPSNPTPKTAPATPSAAVEPTAAPQAVASDEVELADQAKVDQPRGPVEIETAAFNDIRPGESTVNELQESWGAPKEIAERDGRTELLYDIEPFQHVAVTAAGERIISIFVILTESIPSAALAHELELSAISPVVIRDEFGQALGEAFPERGVLFSYATDTKDKAVERIILEEITAEPFVRRAEARMATSYEASLADLEQALRFAPQDGRAYWLRSQLMSDTGHHDEALIEIERALQAEPKQVEYRLTRAKIRGQLGQHEEALAECREILELVGLPSELAARTQMEMGDLTAASADRDYKQAMEHHLQAIKLARKLVDDRRVAVRRAAKEVLVAAHLAVARDVAWGSFNRKSEVVPKWIEQADQIAAAAIQAGDAPGDYHFRLCQQALAAYVGLQGAADPTYWTKETLRTGRALIAQAADPMYRSRLEWELGMTLYDAVQVYHMRRQYEPALEYGPLAISHLESAATDRQKLPGQSYVMGRLYFRVGAVHLAHYRNHARAVPWFDKAVPLMEEPIPTSAMGDIGRQGETFVSMAVSYWETGKQDEAVRLTSQGVKLMEQAVENGILLPEALTIGYNNLSAMHDELGNATEAQQFENWPRRSNKSSAASFR